jgi:DNA-3-methyladenine glycosylase II
LVHIILEQQVSLASARACFDKLERELGQVEPSSFLTLSDETLLALGFSRQKTRYSRILAKSVLDGSLDLPSLSQLDDSTVFRRLTALIGIGPWTANIYLLMALRRPDIWPGGDLALLVALRELYELEKKPSPEVFEEIGKAFKPYRAVAARILWHYYLSR